MSLAEIAATRSTCDRLKTGVILVKDRIVLATGYNGALPGMPHCDDVGHLLQDNHCVATVHAEQNAVAQAAKRGISLDGATCYTIGFPCWLCFKLLISAGIKVVKYKIAYRQDPLVIETAEKLKIELVQIKC